MLCWLVCIDSLTETKRYEYIIDSTKMFRVITFLALSCVPVADSLTASAWIFISLASCAFFRNFLCNLFNFPWRFSTASAVSSALFFASVVSVLIYKWFDLGTKHY